MERILEAASDAGIQHLSLYAFSTENWGRPAGEVAEVMRLLKHYVNSDLDKLTREGVKVRILGRREGLPPDVAEIVERAEARTAHNDKFFLQVAFNYGGRADIVDAARALVAEPGREDRCGLDHRRGAFGGPDHPPGVGDDLAVEVGRSRPIEGDGVSDEHELV